MAFGTFSSAHHLLLTELIASFHARHPHVRVRMVSLNSSEVADAVRDGALEAGLIALPVDDRGLDVSPVAWTSEAVYLSTEPSRTTHPVTTADLASSQLILPEARWGSADPTRRQLLERSQNDGVSLVPIVEVESPASALALAARGVGDTIISLPLARYLGYAGRLHWVSLDPPLYETFAFITRHDAHLSPATRVLMHLASHSCQGVVQRGEKLACIRLRENRQPDLKTFPWEPVAEIKTRRSSRRDELTHDEVDVPPRSRSVTILMSSSALALVCRSTSASISPGSPLKMASISGSWR